MRDYFHGLLLWFFIFDAVAMLVLLLLLWRFFKPRT